MRDARIPLKRLAVLNPETLGDDTSPDRSFRYIDIATTGRGTLLDQPQPLTFETAPSRARRVLRPGDTILSTVRTYLRAVWTLRGLDADLVASTGFVCLRPRSGVDSRFLGWLAQADSVVEEVVARSVGVSYPAVNPSEVGLIKVSCPPLAEQCAIADYLDRETVRIDALIAAKRRMVELLEQEFRVSRIDRVVDRPNEERRRGPAWLGSIPSAWKIMRLKFVARMESGHTPSRQVEAYWIDCSIPWITLNDVSDLEAEWHFLDPTNFVNELGLQNSSAHVLPQNAVVLSRDATVGRSALLGRPMAVSQHFVAWVCGPQLLPEYLLNVLRGPMQHHFGSLTAGATIATIGMPDLNQLVVPIPPIQEQTRIVRRIAAIQKHSNQTLVRVNRQIALLQERRHALITAAVTGQLDIPEAA
jgi:type I restriction enzyme S subunit